MTAAEILIELRRHADPRNIEGMARYGIAATNALGVATPHLKAIARRIRKNHTLAQQLWDSGVREVRHIAALIDDPKLVTLRQMDRWARDFNSWDIVDGVCCHLFVYSPHAWKKALMWPRRRDEYIRRAGFSLMASLAVHDKKAADEAFAPCFELIREHADDDRNFVKKAVNWALRQIGKRNPELRAKAIAVADELRQRESRSARWIGSDAARELSKSGSHSQAHIVRGPVPFPVTERRP